MFPFRIIEAYDLQQFVNQKLDVSSKVIRTLWRSWTCWCFVAFFRESRKYPELVTIYYSPW